jgi:SAM-dependent methyltransferase
MKKEAFEYLTRNEDTHWWHVGKYACAMRLIKGSCPEGEDVLEIGASFGSFSRRMSAFFKCVALDRSHTTLKAGSYPHAVCGDAGHLPLQDESFGLVVGLDVLEHVEDDKACIREALRVLRKGGKMVFFVPACPMLWSDLDVLSLHFRRYTKRSLRRLFEGREDVRIVRLTGFNFILFVPILCIRLLQRVMKLLWKELSTESMKPPPEPWNGLLKRMFLMEGRLVGRVNFPFGVSYIVIAERTGDHGANTAIRSSSQHEV